MKKQAHFMPYQTYHPRQHSEQHQQPELLAHNNNTSNLKKFNSYDRVAEEHSIETHIRRRQQQQQFQPTHNNYIQHLEPIESFNTTAATTTTAATDSSSATNTKMTSLASGNVLLQTNLQQCLKTQVHQQQQQQQQYAPHAQEPPYQQDYNYYYNNYLNNNNNGTGDSFYNYYNSVSNNNNNPNCNYSQQISNQIKAFANANINYNIFSQQPEQVIIKQEFDEEQQYDHRKQLQLPLSGNVLRPQFQNQQQNQLNSLPITTCVENAINSSNNKNLNAASTTVNSKNTNNFNFHVPTTTITAATTSVNDKITMDAREIANFLANELFMQQVSKTTNECVAKGTQSSSYNFN